MNSAAFLALTVASLTLLLNRVKCQQPECNLKSCEKQCMSLQAWRWSCEAEGCLCTFLLNEAKAMCSKGSGSGGGGKERDKDRDYNDDDEDDYDIFYDDHHDGGSGETGRPPGGQGGGHKSTKTPGGSKKSKGTTKRPGGGGKRTKKPGQGGKPPGGDKGHVTPPGGDYEESDETLSTPEYSTTESTPSTPGYGTTDSSSMPSSSEDDYGQEDVGQKGYGQKEYGGRAGDTLSLLPRKALEPTRGRGGRRGSKGSKIHMPFVVKSLSMPLSPKQVMEQLKRQKGDIPMRKIQDFLRKGGR
uniref:Uncharacterized protein n=1 Tax=Rhipicephalus appendiculatus TaxID=34631 RepID=A0A131YAG3_RHIAP